VIAGPRRPRGLGPRLETVDAMVGERWLGCLIRWLALGSIVSVGGCASVEYRVPTWEVQRLTQLPPAMRGGGVRVVPVDAAVPPPSAPVADTPPPPEVQVGVDVQLPVVVGAAPTPVVVAPRPVLIRQVGSPVAVGPRGAPPAGGGWKAAQPSNSGGWKSAPTPTRSPTAARVRSSGGGHHGGGGGSAAGVAVGAVAAVGLIVLLADAAATAAAADAARLYDGWVAVDAGHPLHLFYGGGGPGRVVPLAQLGPGDLIGLQYAVLAEDDGHVEPLRGAPPPPAAPPRPPPAAVLPRPPPRVGAALPQPPPQVASPQPTPVSPPPPGPVATQRQAPAFPPAPVAQVADPEAP
jgi:hypothetical protein